MPGNYSVVLFQFSLLCIVYFDFSEPHLTCRILCRGLCNLPPASEEWGRYYFHRCLSVHTWGYPSPRFFPRSLFLGPFWGKYHSPGQGIPQSSWGVLQDRGTPTRTGLGYHPSQDRCTPGQDRTGVSLGLDWGTSPPPRQNSRARTCYAAGSMPLAFTQEDFLFSVSVHTA